MESVYVDDEVKECFAVDMTCVQSNVKQAFSADNWDGSYTGSPRRISSFTSCTVSSQIIAVRSE